ncbi:MAG: hypothetical protein SPE11_09960 [Parabacteroides sp.]|nr:hypothetical protein [Parabacteroides sp.]
MMELKDFIRDTLLDIVQGVKEAQACNVGDAIISPSYAGSLSHKTRVGDTDRSVQMVDFEVVLGESECSKVGSSGKVSITAVLASVGLGAEYGRNNNREEDNNRQTVVKFSIPVILPSIATNPKEKRRVSHSL